MTNSIYPRQNRQPRKANATFSLGLDYQTFVVGASLVVHACFEWLSRPPQNILHAIVTDPSYGVKEYDFDQIEKPVEMRALPSIGGFA
jgi:hypothetical protein